LFWKTLSVVKYIFFMIVRAIIFGSIPVFLGIYYLPIVTPALGTNNIVFMAIYFSFVPVFLVVFIESFLLLNRLTEHRTTVSREREKYKLK